MADKISLRQQFNKQVQKLRRGARPALAAPLAALALSGSAITPAAMTAPTPSPTHNTTPADVAPLLPAAAALPAPAWPDNAPTLTYDQRLFQFNALEIATPANAGAAPKPVEPPLPPAEQQKRLMEKLCFTDSAAAVSMGARQQDLATAIANLQRMPLTGKPLLDLAAKDKVQFCGLERLPVGIAAQYLPGSGAVVAAPEAQKTAMALRLAHELTHAAQHDNHLLNYETDWDIQSRVSRNLSIEAAAIAAEFRLAYEAKSQGDLSYWAYLSVQYHGTPAGEAALKEIDDAYAKTLAGGGSLEAALNAVGAAAWTHVFDDDGWRNFYLDVELNNYAADIAAGLFAGHDKIDQGGFGPAEVAKAGQVGNNTSFTEGLSFPDFEGLLARNEKMRWAYQLADIARLRQMEGPEGKRVAARIAAAEADKNPYLALDIAQLYRHAQDASWQRGRLRFLYEYMDAAIAPPAPAPAAAPVIVPGIVPVIVPETDVKVPVLAPLPALPPVQPPPPVSAGEAPPAPPVLPAAPRLPQMPNAAPRKAA